jgi:predicted RNase H-like nuclease (RuvC/YqgF family)
LIALSALLFLTATEATSQRIPAEVREGFILLEKDIHDRIEAELDTLDSLRQINRELQERLNRLRDELNDKDAEIASIQQDMNRNEAAIQMQLYDLKATIRMLKIEIRDHKIIMDKYAQRKLTDNQKKALLMMGIMGTIVGTWITLDAITN